jgi:hypothetical protein
LEKTRFTAKVVVATVETAE